MLGVDGGVRDAVASYSPSSMSNGITLAPILETDDIAIEAGDHHRSSTDVVEPNNAVAAIVEGEALGTTPSIAKSRRPSLLVSTIESTIESTRRSISQRSKGLTWRAFIGRLRSIGLKHAKTPPEAIRNMQPRARTHFYLSQPEESQLGWIIHHVLLVILIVNMAIMATETLDGPRYGSSSPAYPYLPSDGVYLAAENGFTIIYFVDFWARAATASNQKVFWKQKLTWVKVVAWLPAIIYQGVRMMNKNDPSFNSIKTRGTINYLRLARLLRIIAMTRVYVGSKVMFSAIKESIAPLKITVFFLITVVMVFATAIFYAEPCYDLKTCTFTDIFNAGYFVMVTVATVGYGSQVPSLYNPGSLILTIIVMIFGSLYLAMPLAIIGIRYDTAWREYERKRLHASQTKELSASMGIFARTTPKTQSTISALHVKESARHQLDETLQPLESRKVYTLDYLICDRFYDISHKFGGINALVTSIVDETAQQDSSAFPRWSLTPPSPKASSFSEEKSETAQVQRVKARNEATVKVLECVTALLRVHKKICSEIRGLLPGNEHTNSANNIPRSSSATLSMTKRDGSFSKTATIATGMFGRVRRALSTAGKLRSQRVIHQGPPTWRSKTWDVLEHIDTSRRARIVNRFRLYLVILSIALFYAQTTPELQATGIKTHLCSRSLADFCHKSSPGFSDQPGCHVLDNTGKASTIPVDFYCNEKSTDPACYMNGFNYGSDKFPTTCAQAFGRKGIQRICNNRLCKPPVTLWVDMEKKWIAFEFFFGILFTVEMVTRVVVHPDPKNVYRDLTFLVDITALFPFYVELGEIISGTMPVYSVVPTAPSFFAVIRVLKTFRVLKLGPHISGSEVLARSAYLVYKRLMIPVFFLFIGSVICGAIFYELERGTECFVGKPCIWWKKELLTPAIVKNQPQGKRLMVQNERLSLITDMLRSTWFSIVTITTVGYGDLKPRTPLGRFFDILTMIMSACYTAMPLTLVGGQFYVCYEIYLRDKRRKKTTNTTVEPKLREANAREGQNLDAEAAEPAKVGDSREPSSISLAGLSNEPVIPGLNAPIVSPAQLPPSGPVLATRRDVARSSSSTEPKRPAISSVELQILNQFILLNKVLSAVIEDLSHLNKIGSQRVATKKDKADEIASLREKEAEIESKISENMVFCDTVFLNFAPVIEKILGFQESRASQEALPMPSILHTAASSFTVGTPTDPTAPLRY